MTEDEKPSSINTIGNISNNRGIITQGQIGNNTINQAPEPTVEFGETTITRNADGTVTQQAAMRIIAPYPPGQLLLQANASGIVSFSALAQRAGVSMEGPSGVRENMAFVTLMQPFGTYILYLQLKQPTTVEVVYQFN